MKGYLSGSFLALPFNINLTVFGISCKIIFIDAENFTHQGGWVIDEQSNGIMGSSYMAWFGHTCSWF